MITNWLGVPDDEYEYVWRRIDEEFAFHPGIDPEQWPGFREPVPSVTWDLSVGPRTPAGPASRFAVDGDEVNALGLAALRDCVAVGEWVWAMDWQHPGCRFWPHRMTGEWTVPVFPNGDYYIFLAQDFRFGTLGHPWEKTLCVFGAELLEAFHRHNDGVLNTVLRRDGEPETA